MKPFLLGLTGSIGMGKSTTAELFAEQGVPVWDADAAVHRLYAPRQPAASAVASLFPDVIDPDGRVNRSLLRAMVATDATVLDRLNAVVHPLVQADRSRFIKERAQADILLLDIPLLYETGADEQCDAVAVVTAPPAVQRARVLGRGMSEAEFQLILSRQLPDAEKCARADYVIETTGLDGARAAVKTVLSDVRQRIAHA